MADGGGESDSRPFRVSERDEMEDGDKERAERSRRNDDDQSTSNNNDVGDDNDPRLDFFSSSFDARLALLSAPGLKPPDPRASVLDNVSACRRLLPPGVEGALDTVRPPPPPQQQHQQRRKEENPSSSSLSHPKPKRRVPALDAIADAASGTSRGPLSLLKRAYDAGARVRVVTRHARGVRGAATGQLCGFDVFMNLILRDVVEEYTVRVPVVRERPPRRKKGVEEEEAEEGEGRERGGAAAAEEEEEEEEEKNQRQQQQPQRRLRHCYRLEARRRTLRLVFLRGDSVVLVNGV